MASRSRHQPIVTLLTDFGTRDGYVAELKGVLLSAIPTLQIVDITHDIEPFQVRSAARVLANVYKAFPDDTVHLTVVDPGVGSARKPIIIKSQDQWFVGPDNGVFSWITQKYAYKAIEIKRPLFLEYHTFHGRDVFAPAVVQILQNKNLSSIGPSLKTIQQLSDLEVRQTAANVWEGMVEHIDRFGNAATNIPHKLAQRLENPVMYVGRRKFSLWVDFFSAGTIGRPLLLSNSHGFVEIALREASAAKQLNLIVGQRVRLANNI